MKLRTRLQGAIVAVTAVTLGGAFLTVGWAVNQSQQHQLDDALVAEAREEASEAAVLGGAQLAISDGPGPMANDIGPLTKYGAIYSDDDTGRAVAATETFRGAPPDARSLPHPDSTPFDMYLGQEHLRAVWAAIPGHAARLLLAAPRRDLDVDERFQTRVMWIVLAVAVLWVVVVSTFLLGRFTRGHEQIAAVARRVADGDLSARAPQDNVDDEVGQLGRDLNQMVERLAALFASQREFIALAAHELRSPLTTLYGELSFALRRDRDEAGYREIIGSSLEAARKLKALSEDLLTLARVDAGAGGASIDLAELVREVSDEVTAAQGLVARGVRIEIRGICPAVFGRRLDLARLLRNLLENAARHSPDNGHIEVNVRGHGFDGEIVVADAGPGVAPSEAAHLFEPFFRGQALPSDTPGAGLGLAIAQRIARAHGGSIRYQEGQPGARFIVTLPIPVVAR